MGGEASDWIVNALGIPAIDFELGSAKDIYLRGENNIQWVPKSQKIAYDVMNDNIGWLEHIYRKIGN